jgi:putative membrane protein
MNLLIRILLTAVIVLVIAHFLPGVSIANFKTSIIVAVVLALLNFIVKPILVILTLPITIITLGLFLLIINALMIWFCTKIVDGFVIHNFLTALLFSLILSVSQSILFSLSDDK